MKRIILILLFLAGSELLSDDVDITKQVRTYPVGFSLEYQNADYYKNQLCLHVSVLNGIGFYKDINLHALEFAYAPRLQKNNKVDHRFRFLLLSFEGLFYSTLIADYDSTDSYSIEEYLFSQWGVKALEFTNLGALREFTPLQFSYKLILEDRNKRSRVPRVWNQIFSQNEHSFYLIPSATMELSQTKIDSSLAHTFLPAHKDAFWDVPIDVGLKLGYDWTILSELVKPDKDNDQKYQKEAALTVLLSGDYKLCPFNDMNKLSYGISAKLETELFGSPIAIDASFNKNKLSLTGKAYSYDSFSIGLTYFESSLSPLR